MIKGVPRIIIYANQPINVGTELTYDYNDRKISSIKQFPWLSKTQEMRKILEDNKGMLTFCEDTFKGTATQVFRCLFFH
jgi:hypothetical protein